MARRKPRLEGDCENPKCGKHFVTKYTIDKWPYKSGHQQLRYCSKKCQLEAQRKDKIKRICKAPDCGKEFEVFPSVVKNGGGNTCSRECYHKYNSGDNHPKWKGGISLENALLRKGQGLGKWRNAVLNRDGFKCIWCESREDLEVDHIKPWSLFPELRREVTNGRTLCHNCHIGTATYGVKSDKFTRADFEEGGRLEDY